MMLFLEMPAVQERLKQKRKKKKKKKKKTGRRRRMKRARKVRIATGSDRTFPSCVCCAITGRPCTVNYECLVLYRLGKSTQSYDGIQQPAPGLSPFD
jgi:predicted metal-binding transcription factor (methanogenesis marker protein 9)